MQNNSAKNFKSKNQGHEKLPLHVSFETLSQGNDFPQSISTFKNEITNTTQYWKTTSITCLELFTTLLCLPSLITRLW